MTKGSKIEARRKAQEMLMHGIGNVLGYWSEQDGDIPKSLGLTDEQFHEILLAQAGRAAKLFGFDQAWTN